MWGDASKDDAKNPWLQPTNHLPASGAASINGAPLTSSTQPSPFGMEERPQPMDGTGMLNQANACAQSSIETGASILNELGSQRDTLISCRTTLDDTDRDLGRSSSLIRTMFRRNKTTKLILCSIVCLLVGAICLLLWAKFKNNMGHDHHH